MLRLFIDFSSLLLHKDSYLILIHILVQYVGSLTSKRTDPRGSGLMIMNELCAFITFECQRNHTSRFVLRYAGDSVTESLLQVGDTDSGPVLDEFVNWWDQSFLQINVANSKEMLLILEVVSPSFFFY